MRTAAVLWLVVAAPCLANPTPELTTADRRNPRRLYEYNGIKQTLFKHDVTGTTLQFVENSGICETTKGVNQTSGYMSVGNDMNMFYWFFEARSNPTSAPLAMWLNGGPGCSSMIGLFQENGPCHFPDGARQPVVNPNSWNTFANMLYVDQPIGTGFSYGSDGATSTVAAAGYVWNMLQAFYAAFPAYTSRDFGLWTESYGGHYGPEFAAHIHEQNARIDAGCLQGEKVNLVALGINNGWIHPETQYRSYADFALRNNHRQLIQADEHERYVAAVDSKCVPAIQKCQGTAGSNSDCLKAADICAKAAEAPIEDAGDFNSYDIRASSKSRDEPPGTHVGYLSNPEIQRAIGAQQRYDECPDKPYMAMYSSGDDSRSFLGRLSTVVQQGTNVLIWAGDADWICNWMGNLDVADMVSHAKADEFKNATMSSYTVGGRQYGEFKTAGSLSWLRVFDAGHEVPFYQPEVSLQAFKQIMQKQPLKST
ncbi:hypothetical protein RB595_010359 [Gaeumannomyces hyphopodioides]